MSILAAPLTLPVEERMRPARSLYWCGWSLAQIADELAVKYDTIKRWARRHAWDDAPSIRKLEDCLETRLMVLICKEKKTGADYTEWMRCAARSKASPRCAATRHPAGIRAT